MLWAGSVIPAKAGIQSSLKNLTECILALIPT